MICPDEVAVTKIQQEHGWLASQQLVTTYSSIVDSDWGVLHGVQPIIFPDSTESGCREAYSLYRTLEQQGFRPKLVTRQKPDSTNLSTFARDLFNLQLHSDEKLCGIEEFARFCETEYAVEPPAGVLPQGIPLLELKSGTEREILLDGLLRQGDQMTLYAKRGVGKSLFSAFLITCFASGTHAWNGKVCPSKPYCVLIIDGELSEKDLRERFIAIGKGLNLPEDMFANISVRSSIFENKALTLDTEKGWADLEPDMLNAEIIVVDSLFLTFPSCMAGGFSGTEKLNQFYGWCKEKGKTAIVIDHQGKSGNTAFGSMGKDIKLDVAIQLTGEKQAKTVKISKCRNFSCTSDCWKTFVLRDENGMIFFEDEQKGLDSTHEDNLFSPEVSHEEEIQETDETNFLDTTSRKILDYVTEHSELSQKEIVGNLVKNGVASRSTIYKKLSLVKEKGLIPSELERDKDAEEVLEESSTSLGEDIDE